MFRHRRIPTIGTNRVSDINDTITKINESMESNGGNTLSVSNGDNVHFDLELDTDADNVKIEGLDFNNHHYLLDLYVVNNSGSTAYYYLYCGHDYTVANYAYTRIFKGQGVALAGENGNGPIIGQTPSGADNYMFAYVNFDITRKGRFYYYADMGNDDGLIQITQGHGHSLFPDCTSVHLVCTGAAGGGNSVNGFGRDTRIHLTRL